jgi:hypothetical protein
MPAQCCSGDAAGCAACCARACCAGFAASQWSRSRACSGWLLPGACQGTVGQPGSCAGICAKAAGFDTWPRSAHLAGLIRPAPHNAGAGAANVGSPAPCARRAERRGDARRARGRRWSSTTSTSTSWTTSRRPRAPTCSSAPCGPSSSGRTRRARALALARRGRARAAAPVGRTAPLPAGCEHAGPRCDRVKRECLRQRGRLPGGVIRRHSGHPQCLAPPYVFHASRGQPSHCWLASRCCRLAGVRSS